MSHFYSGISGSRGPATRQGTKDSGIDGYVQSWGARLSVSMNHNFHEDFDWAHLELGPGPSSGGGRLAFTFKDASTVVDALAGDDPKIKAITARIHREIAKLNDEAPAAVKRIERKRKIEANRRQREFEEKQARLTALGESITDEERDSYLRLVMNLDPHTVDPIEQQDLKRWGYNKPERINESILRGYGNVEPYRDQDGNLIMHEGDGWSFKIFNLTSGVELDKDVVSSAGPV